MLAQAYGESYRAFHPRLKHCFAFLGFDFQWKLDRQGVPRVKRHAARKRLQAACRRIKEWIKLQPTLAWRRIFRAAKRSVTRSLQLYGVRGKSHSLYRFYGWAINCAFKWLNRRSWRRSYTWEQFGRVIEFVSLARPCITEIPRRRVFA